MEKKATFEPSNGDLVVTGRGVVDVNDMAHRSLKTTHLP